MTILDVLNELNVPFKEHRQHHHVRHGWLGVDCPNCSPGSGRYRCGINVQSLAVSCWTCGKLRLGDVLSGASGRTIQQVMPLIRALAPRNAPDQRIQVTGRYTPPAAIGPLAPPHRDYLSRRGFDPDYLAEEYGVAGIADAAELKWRVFIPVPQPNGKSGSWTTRTIGNRDPRYISASPEQETLPIKTLLFGEQHAGMSVVVTEGVFDAMRIGPGAVAVMGVNVYPQQIARIAKYPVRAIVFDSDEPGQRRARDLADALTVYPGETYVVQLSGKDPAESPADEIAELRNQFLE